MTYRNRRLLDLAKDAPMCFCCQRPNDGTVVMAHSNQQRDGKGMGLKASDAAVAALCAECHREIDQGSRLNKWERQEMWEGAHRATLRWLVESERLKVAR